MTALLLDTCAIIYMIENPAELKGGRNEIAAASEKGELYVSPISALEIGRLAAAGRIAARLDPLKYFKNFLASCGGFLTEMSPEIMISASYLPHFAHKDPVDRILISTARELNLHLVTNDRNILAYAAAGYVKTLAC